MDIWSWISQLPESERVDSFQLGSSNSSSIELRAERVMVNGDDDSKSEVAVSITFSVHFVGFNSSDAEKPVWTSDTCPLSSEKPFLPLVLQLLQEIAARSPNAHWNCNCPRSQLQKLKPDPVSWVLDSHAPESFSSFFDLVFLTRLFWLCVLDAPAEVGSFYFHSVLAPNLDALSYAPVLKNFLITVGTDVELCFLRTLGYILAKLLILKDIEIRGQKSPTTFPAKNVGFSYATEAHGLWILKGYSPVKSMQCVQSSSEKRDFPAVIGAKESFLKYALAHQQLEAVIQMEYSVEYSDNYIQVKARVDNLRFHVVKLGFSDEDSLEFEEKHFPSRVRVWVGPEIGESYVAGLTLGRSTDNVEKEMEMQRTLKGKSGNSKVSPAVKSTARIATRTKMKNWRWDQDVEGNAAVFEAVLCDNSTGVEVAAWKPPAVGGNGFPRRYAGGGRPFAKSGGLIFSGEDCGGGGVAWRVSKEMEGSVVKWRIGGRVWVSYCPNDIKSSYFETRCVEWCDEVDLPLIAPPASAL
ncbi:uncharacterized protein LOC127251851 [Andrographis paniculata]|uniref:uncharacterized protein LOC127251851 n=1 Tax=Andrographis paniculata TaxID=175694 RepID=UPI0021E86B89|nr:uncharacterized protein LOC127251851 [Andrographis paniculata]